MSSFTIQEALQFLTAKGFEISLKAKEVTGEETGKIIQYPTQAERLYGGFKNATNE
jgi:hypothetical protein